MLYNILINYRDDGNIAVWEVFDFPDQKAADEYADKLTNEQPPHVPAYYTAQPVKGFELRGVFE